MCSSDLLMDEALDQARSGHAEARTALSWIGAGGLLTLGLLALTLWVVHHRVVRPRGTPRRPRPPPHAPRARRQGQGGRRPRREILEGIRESRALKPPATPPRQAEKIKKAALP